MDAAAVIGQERQRPDRGVRYFIAQQTRLSTSVLLVGASALALLIFGTIAILTAYDWTPTDAIAAGIQSPELGVVAILSIAIGGAAAIVGWSTFRRMPTKPSKEAAIGGAVLGVQAALFAAALLWFRGSDVERFARNFLDFQLLGEFWTRFIRGAYNTIVLSVLAGGLGIILGLILALFTMSSRRVVRAPARAYINFFRGTPLIWQISFVGLGVVSALRLNVSVYTVAILVLALNSGAYSAEIFRAGIQSLERGQIEAARSLGMSLPQALRHVIVPQAVLRVIPPLTNEFVILIKDTALVSLLGLTFSQKELLGAGRDIYASTFNATAFLGSAAGYLVITLPMIRLVTYLEKKLRSGLASVVG
ncbi:MAG: amino acid ABC transporter permease [Acidimicrobiia bacterium]